MISNTVKATITAAVGELFFLKTQEMVDSLLKIEYFHQKKFCSESESWYYFGFQYQTYISYIEDTHQILFGFATSFKSYCVHMKSPRTYVHPDRQTDRHTDGNFFLLVLSSKTYKSWTFVKRREYTFFFTHAITIFSLFTYSVLHTLFMPKYICKILKHSMRYFF